MNRRAHASGIAGALLLAASAAGGLDVETEGFDGGEFTNPFFQHQFEFDHPCCRGIEMQGGSFKLHLRPNTDLITFDLAPDARLRSFCLVIEDYEGGIRGDDPTSIARVEGESGDFVILRAKAIGVPVLACADETTPGRLTGEPIGPIANVMFQAANEGNDVVPELLGAYFDDLEATIRRAADVDGDGTIGFDDLLRVLAAWGPCPPEGACPEDVDRSGTVDFDDVLLVLAQWS